MITSSKDIIVEVANAETGEILVGANTSNDTRFLHYEISVRKELASFYNSAIVTIYNLSSSIRDKLTAIYTEDTLETYNIVSQYLISKKPPIYIITIKEDQTDSIFYVGTLLNFYATYTKKAEWRCTLLSAQGINLNGIVGEEYLVGSVSYFNLIKSMVNDAGYILQTNDSLDLFNNCPYKKKNSILKNYNFKNTSVISAINIILSGCQPLPNIGINENDTVVYINYASSNRTVDIPLNNVLDLRLGVFSFVGVIIFNFNVTLTTAITFEEASAKVALPNLTGAQGFVFKYPQSIITTKWFVRSVTHKFQNFKGNTLQRTSEITCFKSVENTNG